MRERAKEEGETTKMAKQEEVSVPIFSSLEPVYGEGSQLQEATRRFDVLMANFSQTFGATPQLVARSPGKHFGFLKFGKNWNSLTFNELVSNYCIDFFLFGE